MRVLAIDPSLRSTGFAVVEREGTKLRAIEFGAIRNRDGLLPSSCLVAIRDRLAELICVHRPDCGAVESVIYVQLPDGDHHGAARGAALLAMAERGLEIFEYAPTKVKQAVVGRGGAAKDQVGFMVRALLGLTETPQPDTA